LLSNPSLWATPAKIELNESSLLCPRMVV